MTRDELEAAVRSGLTRRLSFGNATSSFATAEDNRLVNNILAAADDYATAQCAIAIDAPDGPAQAQRRAILEAALSRSRAAETVHWQKPGAEHRTAVCHSPITHAAVTGDRAAVTCGTCRQSRAWQALDVAS